MSIKKFKFMKRALLLGILTWVSCCFMMTSCESKVDKAYNIAMHSRNVSELQKFLKDYGEDANSDQINRVRDKIEELKAKENSNSDDGALGRAVGKKIGKYLLEKKFNHVTRDYVYYRNDPDMTFGFMFGSMGSNLSGIGVMVNASSGKTSRFSYAFLGDGKIRIAFSDGTFVLTLQENGLSFDGRFFEKTYDPQTYRSFFR